MKTLPRTQASIGLCLALSACTLRTYVIDRDGAVTADVARDAVDVAAPDVPLVPDGTTDVPGDGPALDVLDEATDATLDVVPDTRIEPDAADESDSASVPDGPLDAPDAAPDVLDDLPPPTDLAVPPDSLDAGSMPDTLVPTDVPDSAPPRDVIDVIDTGPSCASPRTLCGTSCVDTTTDATHCGRCNTPCPGTTNGAALCASSTCTIRCNDGFVLQGSTCTAVPPHVSCGHRPGA